MHDVPANAAAHPQRSLRRPLRHALRDGVAYAVMTGLGENYIAAYALFLGAGAPQLALLACLPRLFGALAQLGSARIAHRVRRRRALLLAGGLLHALTWISIVWIPYRWPAHPLLAFAGCLAFYHLSIGLGAPLWPSLMGELVPARLRGRFFGARARLMHLTNLLALLAGALALQFFERRDDAQLAFTLLFAGAAVARLCSVYHLARTDPTKRTAARRPEPTARPRLDPRFVRFAAFSAAMALAIAVASPFAAVYMLRDLGFSYTQFTAAIAAGAASQAAASRVWGRICDRCGSRAVLAASGLLLPLAPALWLALPSFGLVLLTQALGGIAAAGFALALGNCVHDAAPADRRHAYWAVHNFFNELGACAGALLGGAIGDNVPNDIVLFGHVFEWASGLWAVMLCSTLLRGTTMLVFLVKMRDGTWFRPLRLASVTAPNAPRNRFVRFTSRGVRLPRQSRGLNSSLCSDRQHRR